MDADFWFAVVLVVLLIILLDARQHCWRRYVCHKCRIVVATNVQIQREGDLERCPICRGVMDEVQGG